MQKNNDINFKRILLLEKIEVKTKIILKLKTIINIASSLMSESVFYLHEKERRK